MAWIQRRGIIGERQGRRKKMGSLKCNSQRLVKVQKERKMMAGELHIVVQANDVMRLVFEKDQSSFYCYHLKYAKVEKPM